LGQFWWDAFSDATRDPVQKPKCGLGVGLATNRVQVQVLAAVLHVLTLVPVFTKQYKLVLMQAGS